MCTRFETSINSRIIDAKETIGKIMDFLEINCTSLISEDKFYLKLMLSELMFNAIRHGNKLDVEKHIGVTVIIAEDGIRATIVDEGNGFNCSELTEILNSSGSDLESECGRGIQLVYSLADEMTFNGAGNEIGFFKRVGTGG